MLIKSSDTELEHRSQLPGRRHPHKGCHKCWSQNNWWIRELKPRVLWSGLLQEKLFFRPCSHVAFGVLLLLFICQEHRSVNIQLMVSGDHIAYQTPSISATQNCDCPCLLLKFQFESMALLVVISSGFSSNPSHSAYSHSLCSIYTQSLKSDTLFWLLCIWYHTAL